MDNRLFDQPPTDNEDLPLELQAAARSYAAQPAPSPSSADTAYLIHVLLREAMFPAQDTPDASNAHLWQILVLARFRVYMLGPWFWSAGILLLLAGILLARPLAVADLSTLLILLLPLTAVLGLTHALRTP